MYSKPINALGITLLLSHGVCQAASLQSRNAIVASGDTVQILRSKGAETTVPITSLSKLMTAMVMLDSTSDMEKSTSIWASDADVLKHSKSHAPIGTKLRYRDIFERALMSSGNRARASLARTCPGTTRRG